MTKLVAAIGLSPELCATALGGAGRNVNVLKTLAPQIARAKKATLTRMANQALAAGPR